MIHIFKIIIFSLLIVSCNNKHRESENQINESQIEEKTNIKFKNENIFLNKNSEQSFEYIFKNPLINDTVMYAYYENNIATNYKRPFNSLIYGRKTQSDGTIIFYAHCPPFLKLETYVIIEDLLRNISIKDTITGEIIEVKTNPNQLITIAMGAFNSNGIANFVDEFTFYSKNYKDTEKHSFIFSQNYMNRNPDTKALQPFKEQ